MAWIYLAGSVASLLRWLPGFDQSPIVKTNATAMPYCCLEWPMAVCQRRLYGMTCEHSEEHKLPESKSSMVDFPARISALQEMESAWKASEADYFLRSQDSLAKYDQASCSWKMCLPFGPVGPMLSPEDWPASGMIVDGECYPLSMWERRTSGKDGGYWPTATDSKSSRNATVKDRKAEGHAGTTLTDFVTLWPTPRASDGEKGGPNQRGSKGDLALPAAVKWATPASRDWKDSGQEPSARNRKSPSLPTQIAMEQERLWTTPCADDTGHRKAKYAQGGTAMSTQTGGQLNPMWVEGLMGYPFGWTEVEDWTMPKRKKPEPTKFCATCGIALERKRFGGRLEDLGAFKRRRFCSLSCANSRVEVGYHGNSWRARQHLKDSCERCGATAKLHAHHKDEDRSNNISENIQTLCGSCHNWWHHEAKRIGIIPCGNAPCLA